MRTAPHIFAVWNAGGPFVGANGRAHSRVTIQSPFDGDFLHTATAGNYATRGEPLRWWQDKNNDQTEIEVPNVKSVAIDRSIEQDAATCELVIFNQWMFRNDEVPQGTDLGQPGYFTPNRGKSRDAQARWGIQPNEWADAFVPNALLRTYQGYGGHDKTLEQCITDGNLILSGVWLVDEVSASTDGTLRLKCRDMAKLLIEQQLYLPLVPADHYPLKYFRWHYFNDAIRASSRSTSTTTGSASPGWRSLSYSDSASDRWYGPNADIHGHRPSDATDGNPDTYWLSVGNSYGDAPWAYDWLEYNVGSEINAIYVNPWAGNYQMFVSVMVDGVWQGSDTIPYDPSYLFVSQSPAVDTGANIPYVMQESVPWETPQVYILPGLYHADKVRVTFHNGTYTDYGPWHYRSGVREFGISVELGGPSSQVTTSVTYDPFFIAAASAHSGAGYITSDAFGDVDAFGDARRFDRSSGQPYFTEFTNGISGMCLTKTGLGYYMVSQGGNVYCFGDAVHRGDPHTEGYVNLSGGTGNVFGIAISPTGNGYWVADTTGLVYSYGDAAVVDDLPRLSPYGGLQFSSIEGHPSTNGFWALRSDGVVLQRGGLTVLGSWVNGDPPLGVNNFAACLRRNTAGTGYWILSQAGQVQAFGTAEDHGGVLFPVVTSDWHLKFWQMMPQEDGGYEIMQGNGTIVPISTQYSFGSPIPGGIANLREDGNYTDYSDIIRDLALWSGFYLHDRQLLSWFPPEVYGNIESTGSYAPEDLPDEIFDKRPVIDAMHEIKEAVGYSLWVDDEGGIRFEPPNWWTPGNFDENGEYVQYVPEIDERVQLTGYTTQMSDDAMRSEIIISSEDPDQNYSSTITTRLVPSDAPKLRGLVRPAMWVNGFFQKPSEQKVMADLIALHIHFSLRQGQVNCVANPAIGINDQVRVWDRVTGESYIHYVRAVSTQHDLESGSYTMTLTTNWLGDETEWAIVSDALPPTSNSYQLSPETVAFIVGLPARSTSRLLLPAPLPEPPPPMPPPPPPPTDPTPPTGGSGGGTILSGFGPNSFTDFPGITFTEQTSPFFPSTTNQLISNLSLNMPNEGSAAVDPAGNGYNGYQLVNFRSINREGPRAAGAHISISNAFIEVIAQSGDHADCVQFFGGSGATIQNTRMQAGGGGATCIFAADGSTGDITLDHCTFTSVPGQAKPGFLVRINSDGADTVHVRHCRFEQNGANVEIAIDSSKIVEWVDVCWLDGTPIPHP